jgi:hypothetical protein
MFVFIGKTNSVHAEKLFSQQILHSLFISGVKRAIIPIEISRAFMLVRIVFSAA